MKSAHPHTRRPHRDGPELAGIRRKEKRSQSGMCSPPTRPPHILHNSKTGFFCRNKAAKKAEKARGKITLLCSCRCFFLLFHLRSDMRNWKSRFAGTLASFGRRSEVRGWSRLIRNPTVALARPFSAGKRVRQEGKNYFFQKLTRARRHDFSKI